jgi:hypothetical protein
MYDIADQKNGQVGELPALTGSWDKTARLGETPLFEENDESRLVKMPVLGEGVAQAQLPH